MNIDLLKVVAPVVAALISLFTAVLTFVLNQYSSADQDGRRRWHSVFRIVATTTMSIATTVFAGFTFYLTAVLLSSLILIFQFVGFVRQPGVPTRAEIAVFALVVGTTGLFDATCIVGKAVSEIDEVLGGIIKGQDGLLKIVSHLTH